MIEIKIAAHPDYGDLRAQVVKSMAALGFFEHRLAGAEPNMTGPAQSEGNKPVEKPAKKTDKKSTKPADEPKQAIQTGEERKAPDDEPEAEEETAQDEADEAADKGDSDELTHDTVRNALGEYVKLYGMAAAQEDGPKLLKLIFKKDNLKISDIPDTQDDLKKALAGVKEMLEKNPFKREKVKAGK